MIKEMDENLNRALEDKLRMTSEIESIENELKQTMKAIKSLGLLTLKLDKELERSWELARDTPAEEVDKRDVK